jgi:hypothetical protein
MKIYKPTGEKQVAAVDRKAVLKTRSEMIATK